MSKVYLTSSETGCIRRKLDLKRISQYLKANNHKIVEKPSKADKIILATCGVTEKYSKNAFKLIKKMNKFDSELIITGCLPPIYPERLKENFKTVPTSNLEKIENYFKPERQRLNGIDHLDVDNTQVPFCRSNKYSNQLEKMKRFLRNLFPLSAKKTKNLIKRKKEKGYIIQVTRGCAGDCSFCASKLAIGNMRSKPIEDCISEFREGIKKSYKSFRLSSSDLGAYGKDINSSLPELISALTSNSKRKDSKFFLPNLRPFWLIKYEEEIINFINREKISGVTIGLQSGSSKILKEMNRYNKIKRIRKNLRKITGSKRNSEIYVHVMVGFPGETRQDFKKTLNFLKEIKIDYLFTNVYSKRPGTKAAEIEKQIEESEVKQRLNLLKRGLKNVVFL